MIVRIVYFDANFYYKITKGDFSSGLLTEFRNFLKGNNIQLRYSPIAFVEIARHINNKERRKFDEYRKILITMRNWCGDNVLRYPDIALAYILGIGSIRRETNDVNDLSKFRNMICKEDTYKQLTSEYNFHAFKMLIESFGNFKKKWRREINKIVYKFNPQYKNNVKYDKLTDEEKNALIQELDSIEFKRTCLDTSIYKAIDISDPGFIGVPKDTVTEEFINKINAYYTAYKTIAKRIIVDGYKVKTNDFDDVHYLVYLGYGQHVRFVTYDERLKGKVESSTQANQLVTMEELLENS